MYKKLLALCSILLLMTGCWDKVEINDTAFIIAMGVDLEGDEYVVSYIYPNLPVYTGQSEGDPLFIRTVKDETLAGTVKKLAAQMSKTLNFEHMEAVIIGTRVLKDSQKLVQLSDYLGRNNEYPRRIPVLTSLDPQTVLAPDHSGSEAVGLYINGIYENNQSVIQNYKLVLQDMLTAMERKESLMIPVLHAQDGVYGIGNALVYKEKPVGVLHMEELEALSWLSEKAEGMDYAIELDEGYVSLEIDKASCDYAYSMDQGELSITARIRTEMQVKEYAVAAGSLLDETVMEQLEQQTAAQLASEAEAIVQRLQNEYQVDLISLLDPLKFQDRELYMEMMKQWDSAYTKVRFQAQAEVVIEKIGIKE